MESFSYFDENFLAFFCRRRRRRRRRCYYMRLCVCMRQVIFKLTHTYAYIDIDVWTILGDPSTSDCYVCSFDIR